MAETETLSPVLPGDVEKVTRRLLEKASERELMLRPIGRGGTRVACMRVAVEMLTEML
ncbi:MAG: hypothetical protein ACM3YM_10360 [Sphingomonadales bacterium]